MKKIYMMIAAMAITGMSNANIVYTDITDATLASGGSIDINFDGTAAAEFTFSDQSFGSVVEPAILFNANAGFVMVSAGQWDVISGVTLNTTIDVASSFLNNGGDGYIDPFWGTTMFPTADTYIGATFRLGTNTHYGWILVNWNAAGTFIVKSFAYQDTPNTAINAGDIGGTTTVLVTSISIQGQGGASTITTSAGTLQITETVLPATATNDAVTWSVANGTGSATISSTGLLTATGNGTVTVTATAADASGATGTVVITISNQSVGIQESVSEIISIYPNPASDFIKISDNREHEIESITIYSFNGKTVLKTTIENPDEKINISNLSSGYYMLVLTSKDGSVVTKKLTKN